MKMTGYFLLVACFLTACGGSRKRSAYRFRQTPVTAASYGNYGSTVARGVPTVYKSSALGSTGGSSLGAGTTSGSLSASQLLGEVNLQSGFIAKGTYGRKVVRPMRPKYITIHSTQNYSGDAWAHARALHNGKLRATKRAGGNRIGFLTWHFTVQDNCAVQHMPTTEQGEHADFDGPGNNYSIGIEMCEHTGNNRAATIERTAKLAAYLMREWNIPLQNVVPHYHWPRYSPSIRQPHKNCPHFLMDNGRPGAKWQGFLSRVNYHYRRLAPGSVGKRI